jgi:putative transposase
MEEFNMPRRNHNPTVFDKAAELIVEQLKAEGKPVVPQEILGEMCRTILSKVLETERDQHLGYERYNREGKTTSNSRNGYSTKTVKSQYGPIELAIPRDREGTFTPKVVKKNQVDISGLDDKIIGMYSSGMTDRDISNHIRELYGIEMSAQTISEITDTVIPELKEWQNRQLLRMYAYIYMDAAYFHVRENGSIVKKANYSAIGVNLFGQREVLGMWVGDAESASYWGRILNSLKARGVEDVFLFAVDGLKGLPEAIKAVYPEAKIQRCVVHQLRNCFKLIPWKDRRAVANDMKPIYNATTREAAELALDKFEEQWGKRYPKVISSWRDNWVELSTYYDLPTELRKLIYTTNAIEAYNRGLRKYTKARCIFPNQLGLEKALYLAMKNITKKWTGRVGNWTTILNELMLYFPDRVLPEDLEAL